MFNRSVLAFAGVFAAAFLLFAAGANAEKPADLNKDGIVDSNEKAIVKTKGKAIVDKAWEVEADLNKDGVVDMYELKQWKESHKDAVVDASEWEGESVIVSDNTPGVVVVTEPSDAVIRHDNDNNPPGAAGGPGTNWENPAGPAGGPGASPNRRGGRR